MIDVENDSAVYRIRIIDPCRVQDTSCATQILAAHGADVINIEPSQSDKQCGHRPPFCIGYAAYSMRLEAYKTAVPLECGGGEAGR